MYVNVHLLECMGMYYPCECVWVYLLLASLNSVKARRDTNIKTKRAETKMKVVQWNP